MLDQRIPKFLYFSDYDLLPSKMNLIDLAQRVEQAKSDSKFLKPQHRAVLALLRMAGISIKEFTTPGGYEQLKAKIEGVSISLTDQIMQFWKQNENLEVEVDIKTDSEDEPPFNNGVNLYLRIKNRRHRGVSTPFQQRSRGFIWFFSFLVWFDSVQHQIDSKDLSSKNVILLLDEPGLSLHALAQDDFLRYIDDLSKRHQVLYTTHSPFMINPEKLYQIRLVEDKEKVGTVISSNISSSDSRTIFPLQAALGYDIAQNLFISKNNLLVEGPSDLIYLTTLSSFLESIGRDGLIKTVTIVPVGGLDKVATFISLLAASKLNIVCLLDNFNDIKGKQRVDDLVKSKIIKGKNILFCGAFSNLASKQSDLEDLFNPEEYLDLYNEEFGGKVKIEDLMNDKERIIERISTRIGNKFNHYRPANLLAKKGIDKKSFSKDTLDRFENLLKKLIDYSNNY